ncbi:MAG: quinoprotein dehydrogenase-associated putative ABC transporter substrate-binding protein [Methylotenera sp.]|uniref:quinoprotein dehydrogenase-associated putative ABC transporter substrate-binding protein n=1 Tax=Methylotenera sp. TaxID=2051956 RepID=UPI002489E020|nr:quinoprotein dehydrogenase-associated putative ABC transporter substrate-binding protein [Methylotenera sp.]MDI1309645.1 quinoprotein dehydrogenase-associated putative ABC transporter substrate-binding protein [Methylotenera sp.]
MFKHVKKQLGLTLLLAITANISYAADPDIPSLSPDEGRIGEVRRVVDESEFKVCADPENLPYADIKKQGFEDKIAELLANDLGKKLTYTYAYSRQGFFRNTLGANRCDVVIGTVSDDDMMRTSKPYYRTGNVFVWRKESNFNITDWTSPDLHKGFIGVVDHSPATIPMDANGLISNARPYRMQRDLNLPAGFMIDDLAKGDIDIAIAWGPIGGYYAKQSKVPMMVVPVPEYETQNAKGKEYWNISVGVRKKDKDRMAMIQGALDRNQDKIMKILDDYGIPHVPVVEGDSLMNSYKKYGANSKKVEAK